MTGVNNRNPLGDSKIRRLAVCFRSLMNEDFDWMKALKTNNNEFFSLWQL